MTNLVTRNAILAGLLVVGCSGGGDGGTPTGPVPVPTASGVASFVLDGAGYNADRRSLANASGNLVFCRASEPGPNTIWIRFAQSADGDGANSPHVDIDLCNFPGSTTYSKLHSTDGRVTCTEGQSFGIWWHDGARAFSTDPGVTGSCSVTVTRGAGTIDGSFDCDDIPFRGRESDLLDIRSGTFQCAF